MPEDHGLFLNSITPREVRAEKTDAGTWLVRGLPIMRVGQWNGTDYTAADLRTIASNFATKRDEQAFEPGMWPRHNYQHDGTPVPQDASSALGWYRDVTFDDATGALLGDVEFFDEKTVQDMKRGRLRYISAEVRNSPDTGRSLAGAAFVHDPAVKGLPWRVVINAADYDTARKRSNTTPTPKGGIRNMGIFTKFVDAVKSVTSGNAEPEVLDEAAVELDGILADKLTAETPAEPTPQSAVETQAEDITAVDSLTRQLTQKNRQVDEQQKQIDMMQQQINAVTRSRQHDLAEAKLDHWATAGYLPPTARDWALPLAQYCLRADTRADVLSADGGKSKHAMIDVLEEVLKLSSPSAVTAGPTGSLVWMGSDDFDGESDEELRKIGEEAAALVNRS